MAYAPFWGGYATLPQNSTPTKTQLTKALCEKYEDCRVTEENENLTWFAFAQCWADHPLEDTEFYAHLNKIEFSEVTKNEFEREIKAHICSAFALFSLGVFISAGMALPDWYFPEEEVKKIKNRYKSKHKALMYLNPFWLIGYLISLYIVKEALSEASKCFKEQ